MHDNNVTIESQEKKKRKCARCQRNNRIKRNSQKCARYKRNNQTARKTKSARDSDVTIGLEGKPKLREMLTLQLDNKGNQSARDTNLENHKCARY